MFTVIIYRRIGGGPHKVYLFEFSSKKLYEPNLYKAGQWGHVSRATNVIDLEELVYVKNRFGLPDEKISLENCYLKFKNADINLGSCPWPHPIKS